MPSLLESTDYEKFSLKDWDTEPLSLEEALKTAAAMRAAGTGSGAFVHIVPVDRQLSGFRVETVSRDEVFERYRRRLAVLRAKWLRQRA